MERLKQKIVAEIQTDAVLFGKVANALGIKPVSLVQTLAANSTKLTQVGVIRVLMEHLGIDKDSELLTKEPQPATV
jgi:hypothetical protein